MRSMLLTLALWAPLAHAGAPAPPPPVVEAPASDTEWDAVLAAARDLDAAGQVDAAQATLDAMLADDLPATVRTQALAQRDALPLTSRQFEALTRLAVVQTAAGAYLLGPHLARLSYDPTHEPWPYYVGALGGAALGAGSAVYLGLQPGFGVADTRAIVTTEILGGATGAALGLLVDEYDVQGPAIGVLAGVGVGAVGGVLLSRTELSPTGTLAAQSGVVWGAGLGGAGLVWMSDEIDTLEPVVLTLALAGDAGAVLGYFAAERLDLTVAQVRWADLGLALGAGAGGLVVAISEANRTYSYDPQFDWEADQRMRLRRGTAVVTISGLGGGVLAAWLSDPDRRDHTPVRTARAVPVGTALVSGTPDALVFALPVPTLQFADDGAGLGLGVAAVRF